MELKVWVEGIVRVISGVDERTTCQDVVYALAHATGKTGRFTLIEKWRNSTRLLAPNDSPLKILNKLGEYSGEVQFILQKSEKSSDNLQGHIENVERKSNEFQKGPINISDSASTNLRDVGIGIPQKNSSMNEEKKQQAPISNQQQQQNHQNQQPSNYDKLNSKEDLNSFNSSNESNNSNNNIMRTTKPPPYIPPPKVAAKSPDKPNIINPDDLLIKDLIQLIKLQREKIINQQNDLSKFDAEIGYLERRNRDQSQLEKQHLELINKEIAQQDAILQQGSEQLNNLKNVEEEKEYVSQCENSMKAEMNFLKSKLNVLETELLQYKNKLKKLVNEIQLEQKHFNQQYADTTFIEQKLMTEVERIKTDIDCAAFSSDNITKSTEALKHEVMIIEMSIVEKKKQLEKLVQEMKQVNLESLSTSDEHCPFVESTAGNVKRKIIGSPRQLENAVATSKNPQGVWV